MKKMVDKLLQQYGTAVQLHTAAGTVAVKAFFHPVDSKSLQSIAHTAMPLGTISRGQYTYAGPGDVPAAEGDTLTLEGKTYCFRRVERYYYADELVYLWGLCVEKGGG